MYYFNTSRGKHYGNPNQSKNAPIRRSDSGWGTSGGQDTQDKVFLLNYAEAWEYFASDSDRACYATTYALSREAEQHDPDNHSWWWLRSPGETDSHAAYVNFNGTIYSNAVGNDYVSVRPALWIDIATYQTLND